MLSGEDGFRHAQMGPLDPLNAGPGPDFSDEPLLAGAGVRDAGSSVGAGHFLVHRHVPEARPGRPGDEGGAAAVPAAEQTENLRALPPVPVKQTGISIDPATVASDLKTTCCESGFLQRAGKVA
jgi:hypothetical protein